MRGPHLASFFFIKSPPFISSKTLTFSFRSHFLTPTFLLFSFIFLLFAFSFFLYVFFSLPFYFHIHDATPLNAGNATIRQSSPATFFFSLSIFPIFFSFHSLIFSYMKSRIHGCCQEHSSLSAFNQATHGHYALQLHCYPFYHRCLLSMGFKVGLMVRRRFPS